MADKTQFPTANTTPAKLPDPGVMCCVNCRFAQHPVDQPLAASDPFVQCRWGPPCVVLMPAGIDPHTGQAQLAIKSRFPAMGYREFCHRFETRSTD